MPALVVNHLKVFLAPILVVVSHTVCALVRSQQYWGCWSPDPSDEETDHREKHATPPHWLCQFNSFYDKPYKHNDGDPPKNPTPFKVTGTDTD